MLITYFLVFTKKIIQDDYRRNVLAGKYKRRMERHYLFHVMNIFWTLFCQIVHSYWWVLLHSLGIVILLSPSTFRWKILLEYVLISVKTQSDTTWESWISDVKPLRSHIKNIINALNNRWKSVGKERSCNSNWINITAGRDFLSWKFV